MNYYGEYRERIIFAPHPKKKKKAGGNALARFRSAIIQLSDHLLLTETL